MVTGVFSIPLDASSPASEPYLAAGRGRSFALRRFIGGPENALVRVAADDALRTPASYNPLVLCGPTGTGKSLLARGLADLWRSRRPDSRVVVTTGADFARDYATALQTDKLAQMRRSHRAASLLVLDDLPEMGSKRPAQEELARTIDEVLRAEGRVIVTSRRPPAEMTRLSPALVSRLQAGLTVPLAVPDSAARRVVLKRLAELRGIDLSESPARLLADHLPLTVPRLNHVLLKLASGSDRFAAIDVGRARRFIAEQSRGRRPTLRAVTASVAKHFGVKVADLKGPSRRQAIVRARAVAMYLIRELSGASYDRVGRHFGGRDHTTAMHACRKTEKLVQTDPATRQAVEEVGKTLLLGQRHEHRNSL